MPNIKTITLIHAITQGQSAYGKAWYQDHKDWKKDYNAKYYQQHKDQWKIYNQSNATPATGRQRDKNVTGTASLDTSRNRVSAGNSVPRGREKNVTGTASISRRGSGIENERLLKEYKKRLKAYDAKINHAKMMKIYEITKEGNTPSIKRFIKDSFAYGNFGSNWKSGAKSIIDKGKSIFNKLFG